MQLNHPDERTNENSLRKMLIFCVFHRQANLPSHLVLHLVNVLFYFLIFDPLLLDLICQLGDRKSGVNASGVLQQGLIHESVLALRWRRHRQNKFSF